jgi:dienelactone hydrolase
MASVTKVADEGLVATLHLPAIPDRRPAVIVLGGSDGGLGSALLYGEPIARAGFVALCLAYFAMDGLPRHLSEIPLEYFEKAIDWLRAHPRVDRDRVAIFGSSRGGEAALLVAATFPSITAVVANVPSHVVWQGIHPDRAVKKSSWSFRGTPLPFASLVPAREGLSWRDWFTASIDEGSVPPDAAIPVERIKGPILFVTGTEDGIWPCSTMVDRAMERLQQHGFRFATEHVRYEGAGHAILMPPYRVGPIENPWPRESYHQPQWMQSDSPPLILGGAAEANRLARIDAWPRTLKFLKESL